MAAGERALIIGAGSGLSASLARRCARDGMAVVLAARDTQKLAALAQETGAETVACDARNAADVERLFAAVDAGGERLDLVIFNASGRARGPIVELDPEAVENAIRVTAFGGFLVAKTAAQRMVKHGPWHDPVHRRQRQRQGLSPLILFRDGQIRVARPGARAAAAEHS